MIPQERVGIVHVHSDYSHDGRDSLEELRAACEGRGIGFVGMTDHAEDFDEATFDRYLEHCDRLSDGVVRIFAGLEFRFVGFPGLHLLSFGLARWITPTTPAEFVALATEAAEFTMLAHPLLCRYEIPRVVDEGIDAIEVWNASYNTRYLPDPRAIDLLHTVRRRRPEVVGVAGLDQHDNRNDREARVVLRASEADQLAALKAGRFTNRGRTMSFDPSVDWGPGHLISLRLFRMIYDRVERTQEWIGKRWRRGRA